MTVKILVLLPTLAALAACDGGIGSTGNDTSFERTGVAQCADATIIATGTSNDPVRCGPQVQPVVQ